MLVLLASRFDEPAALLAERWQDRGACLLTCEGLSLRGWRHEAAVPERSFALLGGEAVAVKDIRGVITRLWGVTDAELPQIVEQERAYVAAEMHAFLLAWLASLRCPVLNAPTPLNLAGPGWRQEQWLWAAARVGLKLHAPRRVAPAFLAAPKPTSIPALEVLDPVQPSCSVTLVGGHRFLSPDMALDEELVSGVERLAEAGGVELITANFADIDGEKRLLSASQWVDLSRPDIADALLDRLEARA